MSYATRNIMIVRHGEEALIELTDRAAEATGAIDDAILNQALTDAAATIDSYIGRRYKLPVSPIPPILTRHACTIAFYDLHRGRYTDEVRKEYEDSIAFLKSVSDGRAVLDAAGIAASSAPAEAMVEGPERIFSRDSLRTF